jgi:hypothetical protein
MGKDAIARLRGMFGPAIWNDVADAARRARSIGIKPMHYPR